MNIKPKLNKLVKLPFVEEPLVIELTDSDENAIFKYSVLVLYQGEYAIIYCEDVNEAHSVKNQLSVELPADIRNKALVMILPALPDSLEANSQVK